MSTRKIYRGVATVAVPYVVTDIQSVTDLAIAINPLAGGTALVEVAWGPDLTTPDWRTATNQAAAAMTAIAAGAAANARVAVFIAPIPVAVRVTPTTASCEVEMTGTPTFR